MFGSGGRSDTKSATILEGLKGVKETSSGTFQLVGQFWKNVQHELDALTIAAYGKKFTAAA